MEKRYTYYLVTGVTAFLSLVLIFVNPYPLISINLKLTDFMMAHRVSGRPGSTVTVVAIDEKSLEQIGRWPWDRATFAALVDNLRSARPSAIGLDVVFSEQQHDRARRLLTHIARELAPIAGADSVREDVQRTLSSLPDSDAVLAGSISKAVNVVLGYFFYMSRRQLPMGLSVTDTSFAFSQISSSTLPVIKIGVPGIPQAYFPVVDVPVIGSATIYKGFFNMFPDPDGVVRNYTLVQIAHGMTFPSLGLALASLYSGMQPLVTEDSAGIASIKLLPSSGRAVRVPADNYGRMLINYPSGGHAVPTLSAVDVLKNRFDHGLVSNKVVIIGATAPGLYDLRVTPVNDTLPGVFIHAAAIEQLISRRFLTDLSENPLVNALMILVIAVALIVGMDRISSPLFLVALAVSVLGFVSTAFLLLSFASTILNMVYPVSSIVLFGVVLSSYKYAVEEKKGREVRKAFSHYVSPAVVREITKDPESLKWGGEKKDISILFSDIRGFTGLSASLRPEQVALLLHEYMTRMTQVVFDNSGMLDKYIGDAIMALFGTPLSAADHAGKAVSCGMEMRRALSGVNKRLNDLGLPRISIGIGINSGEAIVGNMGSAMLFDYTAIGDNVNIASRLEGLNKYYGTDLIVSGHTYDRLPSKGILFRLDRVVPQGSDRPVSLYTALPDSIKDGGKFTSMYEKALALYIEGGFRDAQALFSGLAESWPPAGLLADRCALLDAADRGTAAWEGFYRFDKK
ncbi:MAG: adenylate/guanylate cyclase domain-containing protein [Deltaproteobacteria bacterium]|nr:adenylate/guanylate cyclase domain-containing protein [Deltaproteobacteria bacterium]MCL5276446.1 adenylate/guanylate cyclase domain-containing protein [Deltaproteobacteria bacterium]